MYVNAAPESVAKLNALLNLCHSDAPGCPAEFAGEHGKVAIILDGSVISAPQVDSANLASKGFVIDGNFTSSGAHQLAAELNH